MLYLLVKAMLSGVIVMTVSEIAKRSPTFGGLAASLPLVSLLAFIWLWRDTGDVSRVADLSQATFWFVVPTLPMFLALPFMLRSGVGFWTAMLAGCLLTLVLYLLTGLVAARFGVKL
jgi:hypothetical protein